MAALEKGTNSDVTDTNVGNKYEAALNYLFEESLFANEKEEDILKTLQTALNYAHEKGVI